MTTMNTTDTRTLSQRWADRVTEFSGSWAFIFWFAGLCCVWVLAHQLRWTAFDVYPFIFLNLVLTTVSTFQSPLILLSQNRQNETDRQTTVEIKQLLTEIKQLLEQRNT